MEATTISLQLCIVIILVIMMMLFHSHNVYAFFPTTKGVQFIRHDHSWCRPKLSAMGGNDNNNNNNNNSISIPNSEEVRIRNIQQLEELRSLDRKSKKIAADELKIIFEDDHIVCVDKPSGVLCVPSGAKNTSTLAQTVFEAVNHRQTSLEMMVVHRLGMFTSGLVVFAKTMEALRWMNTLFRTRKVTKKYEVLVCGHVSNDEGTIDLPIMRCYIKPPFMRISTNEHQRALDTFDVDVVGKKLVEAPKASQTKFEVIERETFLDTDLPVTRLMLTSLTGRTHQLNVHMAAFGHPIVGDRVYGLDGDALPNGGLDALSRSATITTESIEVQKAIRAKAIAVDCNMCAHAKLLSFNHPITNQPLIFESETPF